MPYLPSETLDLNVFWSWFLVLTRTVGLMGAMPAIGGQKIPPIVRNSFAMMLALAVTLGGFRADIPQSLAEGGVMLIMEYLLGYLLGAIPLFIIGSLAIAGQTSSAVIGLGQANLIDPSLGESVAVLAQVKMLVATLVFLIIDGHHVLIRVVAGVSADMGGGGAFRPDMSTAMLLLERFQSTFELGVIIAAPILVTVLLTQFVLGLITKSVPQVNVFIVSLPLTIGLGLFIIAFTFPGIAQIVVNEFSLLEEIAGRIIQPR